MQTIPKVYNSLITQADHCGIGFSVSKAYAFFIDVKHSTQPPLAFQWLWKSRCQQKQQVYFWLLLQYRVNTTKLLPRKHFFLEEYTCVLCNAGR
jgi:hypothetical protein